MYTANYITKGKRITVKQMDSKISALIQERIKSTYTSKTNLKLYKDATPQDIRGLALDLFGLNDALLSGRSVFAVCEKEPRNLDSGKHYFSVYFIDKTGKTQLIYSNTLYPLIGQVRQDRDKSIRRYIFSSGAIGMSRLLDATDGLFCLLRDITGTYAQI